jgi:LPS export ABC transporter protein LptC
MIVGLEKIKLISSIYRLLFFIFLFCITSCENTLEEIKKVSDVPGAPEERTTNLELIYSDSGQAKIYLNAALAESYYKPVHTIKFKDGVKVRFYNPDGTIKTILTAKYGEIIQNEGKMIARDSVVMSNLNQNQQLLTEELIWTQQTQAINSSKFVTVKTKGGLFYGDGIITTADFNQYEFIKPRGTLNLKN